MKSHFFLVLLLFLVLSSTQSACATNSTAIELNNDGLKALRSSNFKSAISKFKEALKLDPSYVAAKKNLVIAYNDYGNSPEFKENPTEALKQFHKALILNPLNVNIESNIRKLIQHKLERDPNSFEVRMELGHEARKCGDLDGAVVEYRAAIDLKQDAEAYEALGSVQRIRHQLENAIEAFKRAISIKPTSHLYISLGQAQVAFSDTLAKRSKEEHEAAMRNFNKALGLSPNDTKALNAMVAGWEMALRINPISAENHLGLGKALEKRGDFDHARTEYKQAIRFSPGRRNSEAGKLLENLSDIKKTTQ